MRKVLPPRLEAGRLREGVYGSTPDDGPNGAFMIVGPLLGPELRIIASDGTDPICQGWEHVSVSHYDRVPSWSEMCFVKDLFWCSDETVMQIHPPESEYVNQHPFCLHLWRPTRTALPLPPRILVGVKDEKNPNDEERRVMEWQDQTPASESRIAGRTGA
jgi:hypothetical protein